MTTYTTADVLAGLATYLLIWTFTVWWTRRQTAGEEES